MSDEELLEFMEEEGGGGVTPTTWNPADKNAFINLSNGDLTCTLSSGTGAPGIRSVASSSTAKWYYEITNISIAGTLSFFAGIANSSADLVSGVSNMTIIYYGPTGSIYENVTQVTTGLPKPDTFSTLRIAKDLAAQKIWFGDEGGWWNSGDPGAGTNPTHSGFPSDTYFAYTAGDNTADSWDTDFGQSPVYAVPAGFTSVG